MLHSIFELLPSADLGRHAAALVPLLSKEEAISAKAAALLATVMLNDDAIEAHVKLAADANADGAPGRTLKVLEECRGLAGHAAALVPLVSTTGLYQDEWRDEAAALLTPLELDGPTMSALLELASDTDAVDKARVVALELLPSAELGRHAEVGRASRRERVFTFV